MIEMDIEFDRDNRSYGFGEAVSGHVVLRSSANTSFWLVTISYGWRTHGRGDREEGDPTELILADRSTALRPGEQMRLPFLFEAPHGPVSYHGNLLNVDWYVRARVTGKHLDRRTEEDFLLRGARPMRAIMLGRREIALESLPARGEIAVGPSPGLNETPASEAIRDSSKLDWLSFATSGQGLLSLLIIMLFIVGAWSVPPWLPYAGAAALAGLVIALVVPVVRRRALRSRLEVDELSVSPSVVYAGTPVNCRLDLRTKAAVRIADIRATVYGQERVTISGRSGDVTQTHIVTQKTYIRNYDEQMAAGRPVSFRCALPIDQDAAASFSSWNHAVEWFVRVRVSLKGWPGLTKDLPITVLPIETSGAAGET